MIQYRSIVLTSGDKLLQYKTTKHGNWQNVNSIQFESLAPQEQQYILASAPELHLRELPADAQQHLSDL